MRARKVIKKINSCAQYISGAALMILMGLTVVDVIYRQLLNRSLSGTFELTTILLTFIVFFALAYANDHKEHVVIDVVYNAVPRLGKKILSYFSTLINLGIVCLMCWYVFDYGVSLIAKNATTSTLHIPIWPIVFLGGIGMIFYVLSVVGDLIFVIKGGVMSHDDD